jgi:hypothetical protein
VQSRQVLFLINDDVTLARAVEADGVHLGKTDGSVADARAVLGPDAIIGVSCYNDIRLAEQAARDGASYVAFGAVFPSVPSRMPWQHRCRCLPKQKTGPAVGRHWRHHSGKCGRSSGSRCQCHCGDWRPV